MAGAPWKWLGEPLAHDFANTIHWRGTTPVDHIATLEGLHSWLRQVPHPVPQTQVSPREHRELLHLRDATRNAMIEIAAGRQPAAADVEVLNASARRHPVIREIDPPELVLRRDVPSGGAALLGHLTDLIVSTLTDPQARHRMGFCAAPGCGGLFEQSRPNQTWCDPHCGARARADRHHRANRPGG